MPLNLCIFEDQHYDRLYPLSLTRPTYELRCGINLLREKITRQFPDSRLHLLCRTQLADVLRETFPGVPVNEQLTEDCLLVNGRFIFKNAIKPPNASQETVWRKGSDVAAAWVMGNRLVSLSPRDDGSVPTDWFNGLSEESIEGDFIIYPWDLVHHNAEQIICDYAATNPGEIPGELYHVGMLAKENVRIGAGVRIEPGVVLNAEDGPIVIDTDARIMANASLQGPLFVGANSIIKMGAKIYEGTSIGEVCKIGGEVEESIIHSFSNKQHEGFLGHAYLGQWVNIGADSNNSDLKNNYGNVKVYVNGKLIDSGSQFVGLFMGDHSKCGINTMFNTGTVVGVMANIFGSGFLDKQIPSFAWGGMDSGQTYDLEKALEVARRVMGRRKKELTAAQEAVLRHIFISTAGER